MDQDTRPADSQDRPRSRITRNRPALSCSECIRRKIRCDRVNPCAPCVTRNNSDLCFFKPPVTSSRRPRQRQRTQEKRQDMFAEEESKSGESPSCDEQSPLEATENHPPSLPITRQVDVQTEPAVWDMEDYLTGGSMSAKRDFSAAGQRREKQANALSEAAALVGPAGSRIVSSTLDPLFETLFEQVIDNLPKDRAVMDLLVARYFSCVSWHWHVLHAPSFKEEYIVFRQLLDAGHWKVVDPLWLSILMMVLSAAINSLEGYNHPCVVSLGSQNIASLPNQMFKCACAALGCGDWLGEPKIRAIQTICLINAYLIWEATPDSTGKLERFSVIAVRLCQALQLNGIPDDPDQIPAIDDPATDGLSSALKRQLALRLTYVVATIDQMNHRLRLAIPQEDLGPSLPANYDDDQLSLYEDLDPVPRPHLTDASLIMIHYETACIQRRYQDLIRSSPKPPFPLLNDITSRLLAVYDRYQLGISPPNETPTKAWARRMAAINIWTRRVRIVRPWIQFYPARREDEALRDIVTNSARELLRCVLELRRTKAPLVRGSFYLMHVESSFLVLIQRAWHLTGADAAKDDILLASIVAVFEDYSSSLWPAVKRAADIGASTNRLLLETLQDRRRFQGMNESFVHALKRIMRTVRKQQEETAAPIDFAELLALIAPDWQSNQDFWPPLTSM